MRTSPRFSIRRLYPMIWFIDNNFSRNIGCKSVLEERFYELHRESIEKAAGICLA
jgi:hypothetical protein